MAEEQQIERKQAARSFDRVALDYERYRPSYPAGVVERILARTHLPGHARILEVGSGTGKATELFVARGYSVTCIEPGKNLAAVAAEKFVGRPVKIATAAFEDWNGEDEAFDLVVSAQAWHWINPQVGYVRAARALNAHGSLALLWNMYPNQSSPITSEFDEVYRRTAPQMSKKIDDTETVIHNRIEEILNSGYFRPVEVHRFHWTKRYTAAEHIGLLGTYSDHLALPEKNRQRLFEALAEVIERHGGSFERQYLTTLFVAFKAPV